MTQENTGLVFDIQRYSIHDGPGIRTVVFLKGCPLRCTWCANPESQNFHPELFFVRSRCIRCGGCAAVCPDGAITRDVEGYPVINYALANQGDLSWSRVCPAKALQIKGKRMSVDEVADIVMRDERFYRRSHGGMTLSGGEPLAQPVFAGELLKKVHALGISTAVETTGIVDFQILERVAPYVDLFLYDFKASSSQVHLAYTGVNNDHIKENLQRLAATGVDILVRMPLIPGVNDSLDDMRETLDFLQSAGVKRFDLLPYHQLGVGKYASTGRDYAMRDTAVPKDEQMKILNNMVAARGFAAKTIAD